MVKKKGSKKRRKLLIAVYTSGIVGKGKPKYVIKTSVLTPNQWERRFYHSSYHFNTEYAVEVKYA